MKRTFESIISACVLAICLTGCEKEIFSSFSEIRFKAGTVPASQTKTEYGGRVGGTQMVDWRAGDLIRISSDQAAQDTMSGTIHYADYVVQSDGTPDGSGRSVSRISAWRRGLHWGDKDSTHVFYSVYPSPSTTGKSSDSLDEEGNMRGNIPEVQSPLSVSSSSPYVAAPNMIHQYMVAKTTVAAGKQTISEDEVFLNYTPVTTAIQFGVKNKMESSLSIRSIEISSGSKNLSGTFTASLKTLNESGVYSNGSYPAFTASSGAKKTASVSFGDSGLTLAVDDSLSFTVFLLPESNLNDLTFKINKVGGGYIKADLKRDADTWISFARCKKHFVNGLFVNDGAKWTLAFSPNVASWIENVDDKDLDDPEATGSPSLVSWDQGGESGQLSLGTPVEYKFSLATGVSATQTFNPAASNWNVKTLVISSTKDSDAEGWVNEPQGWKIKTVDGNAVTGTSYTTSDGLLTVQKDGYNLQVTDNRQKISYGDNDHWTTQGTDWYRAPLSGTIDLSKRDFRTGNDISMTTANCYVVRNAGTYKIPLVYGNAVVGGNSNTQSYAPTIASGVSNGLTPFVNHLGNGIFNPFIENNTNDGDAKWYTPPVYAGGSGNIKTPEDFNSFLVASSAKVLWQDNGEVIKNVRLGTNVSGHVSNTGNPVLCDKDHVRYIEFTISQDDIRQCNAVIAVYDGANGTGNILWSWHIWITNNPDLGKSAIAVTNNAEKISSFLAAPAIGWIDPDLYEEKDDVTIVLEQEESGELITVTTKHPEYTYYGHGSCYQFGRKDPMRYNVTTDTNAATTVALETSILNPGTFYTKWNGLDKYNLWTGKESKMYSLIELLGSDSYAEEGSDKIKTIYDPSPAGYKVPSVKAFTGFTKEGKKCGRDGTYPLSDSNVSGSYHNGWDFYTNSSKSSTIYFPFIYCRVSGGTQGSVGIGRYRTSTANSDSNDGSFEFQFQSDYVYPMTEKSSRANALPIRPITE